jgi:hypothetical protein
VAPQQDHVKVAVLDGVIGGGGSLVVEVEVVVIGVAVVIDKG